MQENNQVSTPEVVPQTAVDQPKQNNFLTILLSVLLIISVAVSGFFAFQTQKLVNELTDLKNKEKVVAVATAEPIATHSSVVDPTASWKTYTDSKNKFSFKYPGDWIISNGNYLNGDKYVNLGTECLNIKISTYSTTNTLGKFIQQQGNTTEDVSEMKGPKSDQFTNILDKNMIESFSLGQHGSGQIDNIYLKNKQTVLYFRLSEFDIQELPADQLQNHVCNFDKTSIFNQILSTFKFLEVPIPTAKSSPSPNY